LTVQAYRFPFASHFVFIGWFLFLPSINGDVLPPDLQWERTYGAGDSLSGGYWAIGTKNGGYLVTGTSMRGLSIDTALYLVKTDSVGNIEWEYRRPSFGEGSEVGRCAVETDDGGFVITGNTCYQSHHVLLLKVTADGKVEWEKAYGIEWRADSGYGLCPTTDGGFAVTGESDRSLYLFKTDPTGNLEWEFRYPGKGFALGRSVCVAKEGAGVAGEGYVVVGTTRQLDSAYDDGYILKIDSSGKIEWERIISGGVGGESCSVVSIRDLGFFVTGSILSDKGQDLYFLKLSISGESEWDRTVGGPFQDGALSGIQTRDGGYIVAGGTQPDPNTGDAIVIRTDSRGRTIWQMIKAGGRINCVLEAPDAGLVFTGGRTNGNTSTLFLAKTVPEPEGRAFIRGDANGDGKITIADPIWLLNQLFLGGPQTQCLDATDSNGDLQISVLDAVYLVNYYFRHGPKPGQPFPTCGTDTSSLGCNSFPACP
jgi:hypothetical protein